MSNVEKKPRTAAAATTPEQVGVILAGYPAPLAVETAKAIAAKKMNIVLGVTSGTPGKTAEGVDMVSGTDPAALRAKVDEVVKAAKAKNMIVVGVDVGDSGSEAAAAAQVFQDAGVPFVLRSGTPTTFAKPKSLAVISDDFNKYARAMDEMWASTSRRFPGLLTNNWALDGFESMPKSFQDFHRHTESMMESWGKMFGEPTPDTAVKKVRDPAESEKRGVPKHYLQGHSSASYNFKNGDGTSSFSFQQAYFGDGPAAEGIADSVMFLADKAAQQAKPRVFSLVDVMETPPMMARLAW